MIEPHRIITAARTWTNEGGLSVRCANRVTFGGGGGGWGGLPALVEENIFSFFLNFSTIFVNFPQFSYSPSTAFHHKYHPGALPRHNIQFCTCMPHVCNSKCCQNNIDIFFNDDGDEYLFCTCSYSFLFKKIKINYILNLTPNGQDSLL